MGIDIKLPIGLMFSLLGLILTLFGLFTRSDEALYKPSLGINVNLWSGMFMLGFGAAMLLWSRFSGRKNNHPESR